MKKNFTLTIVIILLALAGSVLIFSMQKNAPAKPEEGALSVRLEPEESDFYSYKNTRLGFEMKIPKVIDYGHENHAVEVFDDGKSEFIDIGHHFFEDTTDTLLGPAYRIYIKKAETEAEFMQWKDSTYTSLCEESRKHFNAEDTSDKDCRLFKHHLIPILFRYDPAAKKGYLADVQSGNFALSITEARYKIFDDAMIESIVLK